MAIPLACSIPSVGVAEQAYGSAHLATLWSAYRREILDIAIDNALANLQSCKSKLVEFTRLQMLWTVLNFAVLTCTHMYTSANRCSVGRVYSSISRSAREMCCWENRIHLLAVVHGKAFKPWHELQKLQAPLGNLPTAYQLELPQGCESDEDWQASIIDLPARVECNTSEACHGRNVCQSLQQRHPGYCVCLKCHQLINERP